jgi:neutral ceramidase
MATGRLMVGYADTVVTPKVPCPLVGYGVYLGRTANGVLDDLKARATYVRDARGAACVVVAYDLVGFTVEQADRVRGMVAEACGTSRESVLLSFTHTHSGPPSQYLRGMGEVDHPYLALLESATVEAARRAAADARAAQARWNVEEIEPISFNRVAGLLEPLDIRLGHVAFERDDTTVYLASYSCHPVTLGQNTLVSADYPGRLCRAVESQGNRCSFLQGFCGDVDPFRNKVRWGAGTEEDIDYYGAHLASRLMKSDAGAKAAPELVVSAAEDRVSLPVEPMGPETIERGAERLRHAFRTIEKDRVERFVAEWRHEALAALPRFAEHPALDDIPVQVMRLGPVSLAALPGEVFCQLGISLRAQFPGLFPLGYANGNVGYLPTASAFERPEDYACYYAPRFYGVTVFQPGVEAVLVDTARKLAAKTAAKTAA